MKDWIDETRENLSITDMNTINDYLMLPKTVTNLPTLTERNRYTYKRENPKIGRNELCPCESGKKYKKCCI